MSNLQPTSSNNNFQGTIGRSRSRLRTIDTNPGKIEERRADNYSFKRVGDKSGNLKLSGAPRAWRQNPGLIYNLTYMVVGTEPDLREAMMNTASIPNNQIDHYLANSFTAYNTQQGYAMAAEFQRKYDEVNQPRENRTFDQLVQQASGISVLDDNAMRAVLAFVRGSDPTKEGKTTQREGSRQGKTTQQKITQAFHSQPPNKQVVRANYDKNGNFKISVQKAPVGTGSSYITPVLSNGVEFPLSAKDPQSFEAALRDVSDQYLTYFHTTRAQLIQDFNNVFGMFNRGTQGGPTSGGGRIQPPQQLPQAAAAGVQQQQQVPPPATQQSYYPTAQPLSNVNQYNNQPASMFNASPRNQPPPQAGYGQPAQQQQPGGPPPPQAGYGQPAQQQPGVVRGFNYNQ